MAYNISSRSANFGLQHVNQICKLGIKMSFSHDIKTIFFWKEVRFTLLITLITELVACMIFINYIPENRDIKHKNGN